MASRRGFLKASAAVGAVGLAAQAEAAAEREARSASNRVRRHVLLGRTQLSISDISFGSSRLREGEEALVHHAVERGINYFDTADGYTGGQSERVIGNALKGKRQDFVIASKTKARANSSRESIMEALEASLRRLQTDYVDIYFNHAVNDLDRLSNPEWLEFADRARQQGKIRFTGMSGHAGRLIECLDFAFDQDMVDVVLVAHNFGQDPAFYEKLTQGIDWIAKQPELPRALKRAKSLDVGVVAMKTLMGARLNDMRPYERGGASFAQAAFRWTLANPHVDALVISMTDQPLIDEYLGASGWQGLAQGDRRLLEAYAQLNGASQCRPACDDCAGACPYQVPIADVLRTRMYAADYGDLEFARAEYANLGGSAAACLSCSGEPCRDACTHGLDIAALCAPAHRLLA